MFLYINVSSLCLLSMFSNALFSDAFLIPPLPTNLARIACNHSSRPIKTLSSS